MARSYDVEKEMSCFTFMKHLEDDNPRKLRVRVRPAWDTVELRVLESAEPCTLYPGQDIQEQYVEVKVQVDLIEGWVLLVLAGKTYVLDYPDAFTMSNETSFVRDLLQDPRFRHRVAILADSFVRWKPRVVDYEVKER
jgi:hypothetical protein